MAITFTGGVQVPVIFGNDATTQHLFSLENTAVSRVNVNVRRLVIQNDPIATLTGVMPQVKVSRGVGISGGVLLARGTFQTTQTSDAGVQVRSAMGEGAPITATPGTTVWQQYTSRLHTAAEQVISTDENALPQLVERNGFEFVLRPGESLLVSVIGAAAASNAALANNWMVTCVWEEDSVSTFAISGTVTLSGSPVSGAIVTVVESDDTGMTNAFVRDVITTGAGGTWASTIRTGKVGMVAWQYENAGTLYTAPSAPYLEP